MKKNIVKLLVVFILFSMASHVNAQPGTIEEIEQVMSRKLIVLIEKPHAKVLDEIAKDAEHGSVDDYKKDLIEYNENIKLVAEKFWPYNKAGIQYMTYEEIESLQKSNSTDYAVLGCVSVRSALIKSGYVYEKGLYWIKDIKKDFEDRENDIFSQMIINKIEDWGKTPVYQIALFDVFPSKAALVYGIKEIETFFNLRIKKEREGVKIKDERARLVEEVTLRAPKIAEKTLLIREEWLDKELTADNFKQYYPYKYQICDRETMDQIVMNQDGNYAYGVQIPIVLPTLGGTTGNVDPNSKGTTLYIQYVMDAADNRPMAFVIPGTNKPRVSLVTFNTGSRNFTSKTLTKIAEQIQGRKK